MTKKDYILPLQVGQEDEQHSEHWHLNLLKAYRVHQISD